MRKSTRLMIVCIREQQGNYYRLHTTNFAI